MEEKTVIEFQKSQAGRVYSIVITSTILALLAIKNNLTRIDKHFLTGIAVGTWVSVGYAYYVNSKRLKEVS